MNEHDQRSNSNVVGTPGEGQKDQRGQVVDDLLLKILKIKKNKETVLDHGQTLMVLQACLLKTKKTRTL